MTLVHEVATFTDTLSRRGEEDQKSEASGEALRHVLVGGVHSVEDFASRGRKAEGGEPLSAHETTKIIGEVLTELDNFGCIGGRVSRPMRSEQTCIYGRSSSIARILPFSQPSTPSARRPPGHKRPDWCEVHLEDSPSSWRFSSRNPTNPQTGQMAVLSRCIWISPSRISTTRRAVALGAEVLAGPAEEPGSVWVVHADPARHPFCLCMAL